MHWIKSAGGPLVAVERDLASLWRGTSGSSLLSNWSPTKPNNDYERACEVKDYVGVIDVSDRHAIVLGDMPLATTAWTSANGPFIVRAFFMDPTTDVQLLVERAVEDGFGSEIESISFSIVHENIIIFDSALSGSDLGTADAVGISIHVGRYQILTYEFKPNIRTSLLLHRFFLSM